MTPRGATSDPGGKAPSGAAWLGGRGGSNQCPRSEPQGSARRPRRARDPALVPGRRGLSSRPRSHRSHGGCLLAILVEDPSLDALHHVERPVHRAQIVEVAALARHAEGTRRECYVDLAVRALPVTTAEGPPHGNDDGAEPRAGALSRIGAKGAPKGLARPRSDSAPKGGRGRLRR